MKQNVIIALLALVVVLLAAILWNIPKPEECETCGAHVYETWHTMSDDGEIIHICERCADMFETE